MNKYLFAVGMSVLSLLVLICPLRASAQPVSVVLDNFEVDPYTDMNPDSTPTIVSFPTTATPGGWPWVYAGYGTPASGDRNTTDAIDVASWRFLMPEAANLTDPNVADTLSNAGPVMYMNFNDVNSEPRTLDQVISDLGQPEIDWSQPVTLTMQVKARWGTDGDYVGSFENIRQGILVFSYNDGGSVGTVTDATFAPGDNDTWKDASIELIGQDAGGNFLLGMFGGVDFTPVLDPLADRSPQLEFFFDDLRLNYERVRKVATPTSVPTLPFWAILTLAGLMPLIALYYRRRRKAEEFCQ